MDMRLETLICDNYKNLNDNDKHIWSYILNNKNKCESMSIQELASSCNVSHTTILRFAQKLGLNGYSELKFYLKQDNKNKKIPVFDKIEYMKVIDDINKTMNVIVERDFTDVCELLDTCDRIYAYGSGEVQNNAVKELKRSLLSVGKLVNVLEGKDELKTVENYIKENDIIFLFSISGENKLINEFAKELKQKGTKVISICKSGNSTLSKVSDISLEIYTHEVARLDNDLRIVIGSQFFILNEFLILKYIEYKYSKS